MTTVAIDFGTSNTVVCVQDPVTQTPRTLKFDQLSRRFETLESQVNVVPSQRMPMWVEWILIHGLWSITFSKLAPQGQR